MTATAPPSARPAAPAPAANDAGLTHRQIVAILAGLMAGMFLAALDQTIVASAIRVIGDDLNGLSAQAWVTTAYLITSTISTPLYGKLSDMYGRRPFFLIAITIFVVGSFMCSFATSMYMLAGFRAFQGLGAGGLFSLALTILGDIVPPRQRAKYQGYFLAVFGTSSVLGPVIGGFLAGQSSILGISGWRWVFLVNVPIGALALLIVLRVLHIPHTAREHRVDWQGAVALVVSLVPLLTVAEQGRSWGWGDYKSLTAYAIGIIGAVLFVLAERRAGDDALIPLRFFRNSTFRLVTGVNVLVGAAMFGGLALLPLYLQIVKGKSPTSAGLLLLPLTAGIMIASIVSGQLTARTGHYKVFPVIGTVLMAGAMAGMGLLVSADTSLVTLSLLMGVFGLGLGNIMQPTILAIQNASPPREIGVATSSATFFRQIGATLGTAVFLSVLYSTVTDNILSRFRGSLSGQGFQQVLTDPSVTGNPANRPLLGIAKLAAGAPPTGTAAGALDDTAFLNNANPQLAHPFYAGFADSMDTVFLMAAGILVVAFLIVIFLKELPLRTQSGLDLQRSEATEAVNPPHQAPSTTAAPAAAPVTVPDIRPEPPTDDGAIGSGKGTGGDGRDSDGARGDGGPKPRNVPGRHRRPAPVARSATGVRGASAPRGATAR